MKIAPTLQAAARHHWWDNQAEAELRALLAVARAAQRIFNESKLSDPFAKWDPLDRALARLEQVSRRKP